MSYTPDSTTIDLCLSLFPCAKFRKTNRAIKLHALLDLNGSIPSFIDIQNGSAHGVNLLDNLVFETDAMYVMDLGFVDYDRLFKINLKGAFFITRTKVNMKCKRVYSKPVDKSIGLKFD